MARSRHSLPVALLALTVGLVLASVAPASAACHIAAFETTNVAASPGDTVELLVVLVGGQPSCAGTVTFRTQDGTASEGSDYVGASGTLTFEEGDDREETIAVDVAPDAAGGTFSVVLSDPTGSISGTGDPATVTIEGAGADGGGTATATATAVDATDDGGGIDGVLLGTLAAFLVAVVVVAVAVGMRRRRAG